MPGATASGTLATKLTLGPLLYYWTPQEKIDFYARIADEAPIDTVYLGEVVCSKRTPLFEAHLPAVIDRLQRAGKTVVRSTLALIMTDRELEDQTALLADPDGLFEANDISAIHLLQGRPHVVGPFVNVYNEGSLAFAQRLGAIRVVLGCEINGRAIKTMTGALTDGPEIEVQAFGRLGLALSARCYHARHHGLQRDRCQYVCGKDGNGLALTSLDDQPFLAINGTQTLSHAVCNLLEQGPFLQQAGVTHLRLWPHACDMVEVATVFRAVLDGRQEAAAGLEKLAALVDFAPFSNGFFFGREGHGFFEAALVE